MLGVTGCHTTGVSTPCPLPYKMRYGRWAASAASFAGHLPRLWRAVAKEDSRGVLCAAQSRAAVPVGSSCLQQNNSGMVTEGQARSPGRVPVSDCPGGSRFPPVWQLTPSPHGRGGAGRWLHVAATMAAVVLVFGELAWEGRGRMDLPVPGSSTFPNAFSCF